MRKEEIDQSPPALPACTVVFRDEAGALRTQETTAHQLQEPRRFLPRKLRNSEKHTSDPTILSFQSEQGNPDSWEIVTLVDVLLKDEHTTAYKYKIKTLGGFTKIATEDRLRPGWPHDSLSYVWEMEKRAYNKEAAISRRDATH